MPINFFDPKWKPESPQYSLWFTGVQDHYKNVARYTDTQHPEFGKVAPDKPTQGLLVYADGVSFDPGSGKGYYRYDNGSWVHIG